MIGKIGPFIFGLGGVAVLMWLGFWQLDRLDTKQVVIAEIQSRIGADPVPVPAAPDPQADRYLPVQAAGRYTGERVHVLTSERALGIGSRVIAVLETDDGRRLLVDRGFIADRNANGVDYASDRTEVTGNLVWPDDSDSFTPEPDLGRNLWFSRGVEPIAAFLNTEAVTIAARSDPSAPAGLTAVPVSSADIKNDHLGYAITWFSLAAIWAMMTLSLLWRIRRKTA